MTRYGSGSRIEERGRPKHVVFRESLLRSIAEEKRWAPGTKIDSERKLQIRHHLSRNTVRQAINYLVAAGYLFREVGRGTFVSSYSAQQRYHRPARAKLVGLIVTDVEHDFGKKIAKGAEDYLHQSGYSLVLCQDKSDIRRALRYVNTLTDGDTLGVILDPVLTDDYVGGNQLILDLFKARSIPVVLVDREVPTRVVSSVGTNNEEVAWQAARHLRQMGHRSILVVRADTAIMNARLEGVRKEFSCGEPDTLQDICLTLDGRLATDIESCASAVAERHPVATAVFSLSEYVGQVTYRALRRLGKSIPQDLSFITFDHPEDCYFEERKITCVEQPALQMGKAAARILVELIESGEETVISATLKSRLVVGNSVANVSLPLVGKTPDEDGALHT